MSKPILDQINLVCGDTAASVVFYRRLGMEIPDDRIWSTATGAHHISAVDESADKAIAFDLDSTAFAQKWILAGRDALTWPAALSLDFALPHAPMSTICTAT